MELPYKLSRDYDRLKKLLDDGLRIICVANIRRRDRLDDNGKWIYKKYYELRIAEKYTNEKYTDNTCLVDGKVITKTIPVHYKLTDFEGNYGYGMIPEKIKSASPTKLFSADKTPKLSPKDIAKVRRQAFHYFMEEYDVSFIDIAEKQ
jgi:hypothetical protein